MKASEAVKAKLVGPESLVKEVMEKLDRHYIVLPTSHFIKHDEDPHCHIFITLLEENL